MKKISFCILVFKEADGLPIPDLIINQSTYDALPLWYQAMVDVLSREGLVKIIVDDHSAMDK